MKKGGNIYFVHMNLIYIRPLFTLLKNIEIYTKHNLTPADDTLSQSISQHLLWCEMNIKIKLKILPDHRERIMQNILWLIEIYARLLTIYIG